MQQDKSLFKFIIASATISGLAGILTLYAASYSVLVFFIFSLLTIVPIIAASLVKGIRAGALTSIIALVFSLVALPLSFSISLFISLFFPALYISFMLSIVAVRHDTQEAQWVPLSTILFNICIISVVVVIMLAGYIDTNLPQPLLSDTTFADLKPFFEANVSTSIANFGLSNEQLVQFKQAMNENFALLIIAAMAWGIIASLFFLLLLAVYITSRFVADKKISPRPRNFWPTDLVMPALSIAVFLVAIIVSSFPTLNYTLLLCMISLAIAFALGFFVSGLAFIHHITIGKPWRLVALAITYVLLFSFVFSGIATIIFIGFGVLSTILRAINDNNTQPPLTNNN